MSGLWGWSRCLYFPELKVLETLKPGNFLTFEQFFFFSPQGINAIYIHKTKRGFGVSELEGTQMTLSAIVGLAGFTLGWFFCTFSDLNTKFDIPHKDKNKSKIYQPGHFRQREDVSLSLYEALTLPPLDNSEKHPLVPKRWNQIAPVVVVWGYAKFIIGEQIKCLGVFSLTKWSFVCWVLAINLAWLNTQEENKYVS